MEDPDPDRSEPGEELVGEPTGSAPGDPTASAPGGPRHDAPRGSTEAPRPSRESRLIDLWYRKLPDKVASRAPWLAVALEDGAWLARWPQVAAWGPVAIGLVAFTAPFLVGRYGLPGVYTESVLLMMLAIAGSILARTMGVLFLVGWILGDLIDLLGGDAFVGSRMRLIGGHVVSYALLALLVIHLPVLAHRLAGSLRPRGETSSAGTSSTLQTVLYPVTCALLVFVWTQAMVVLVRPVFTWPGRAPTVEAIFPIQFRWYWLAIAAFAAAAARIVLRAQTEPGRVVTPRAGGAGPAWEASSPWMRVGLRAAFVALLLAGTYGRWVDPILVFILVGALDAWSSGIAGSYPATLSEIVLKFPALIRFGAALVAGFYLAQLIIRPAFTGASEPLSPGESLRPVMYGALVTLLVFRLLFPRTKERATSRKEPSAPADDRPAFGGPPAPTEETG